MKKIVKILTTLFLFGSASNLAGSQNVQTLAVEKNVNKNEKNESKKKSNNEKKQHVLEKIKRLKKELKDSNKNCRDVRNRINNFVMLLTDKIDDLEFKRLNFQVDTDEYASLTNKINHYDSMKTDALIYGGPYEVFENDYDESLRERDEISDQLDELKQELTKIDLEPKITNFTTKISNIMSLYDDYLKEIVNLKEKFNEIAGKLSNQFYDLKRKRYYLLSLKSYYSEDFNTHFTDFTFRLMHDIDDKDLAYTDTIKKYEKISEELASYLKTLKSKTESEINKLREELDVTTQSDTKTELERQLNILEPNIERLNEYIEANEKCKKLTEQMSNKQIYLNKVFKRLDLLREMEKAVTSKKGDLDYLNLTIEQINNGYVKYDDKLVKKIDKLNLQINQVIEKPFKLKYRNLTMAQLNENLVELSQELNEIIESLK